MSAGIDDVMLRDAVFKACNSLDAFESMPYSSIREETERLLDLDNKALKDRKNDITDMIFQFRNVHKPHKRKKSECDIDNEAVRMKSGKYSVHETELIMSTINNYLEVHGLQVSDICCEMREQSKGYKKHADLWRALCELLPNRKKVSIQDHAKRKLMESTRTGTFTEEEKKTVLAMSAVYGNAWKRISNELGRMGCDVKDLCKIIKNPRKNKGHFTLLDRARLIMAVKEVTGSSSDLHAFEINYHNVSWIAVATLLNNERLPLDYLRHWKVIRRTSWLGPELSAGMVTSAGQHEEDRKLIAYLAER